MPVIARQKDKTRCPAHAKGEITDGEGSVLVCFQPVARKGDKVKCLDGSIDTIIEGDASVLVGGQPVACKGHRTAHGGEIETGCPRVWIGRRIQGVCTLRAARRRAAFIRYVPKRRKPLDPNPF